MIIPAASAADIVNYSVSPTTITGGAGTFTITVSELTTPYAGLQYTVKLPAGAQLGAIVHDDHFEGASVYDPQNRKEGNHPDEYTFSCYMANENKYSAETATCRVNVAYTGTTEAKLTILEVKQVLYDGEHIVLQNVSNTTVDVTLQPGTGKLSDDATLKSLSLSTGTLTPAFTGNRTAYTAAVSNSVNKITVSAVTNHPDASVTGNGDRNLNVGDNLITVIVTAADGVTKSNYNITVNRAGGSTGGPDTPGGTPGGPGGSNGGDSTSLPPGGTPSATIDDLPFTDVKESDWFSNDVYYMWKNNLMDGTSSTLFSPARILTRGMVVTVLYRRESLPDVTGLEMPFSDVPAGQWYTNAVLWAADNGIVEGYPDGTYRPDVNISRQDLALILTRYEVFSDIIPAEDPNNAREFSDQASIREDAKDAVNTLVLQGIIQGRTNGTVDPRGNATRAEFAAMLHRILVAV